MDEVGPLIKQSVKNCLSRLLRAERNTEINSANECLLEYDYSDLADYERFHCIYTPDWETLCQTLAESSKKSVVFVNNKE